MAAGETTYTKGKLISEESERAILGAVLLDNTALEQTEGLKVDDFALDSHRRIFRCMREMSTLSFPIDLITLTTELSRKNELEAVGGASYVSSLTDSLPKVA